MKKDEEQFEEALRQMDFSRPSLIMRSIPEVSKEKWTKRIAEFENSIDNRIEELRQLAEDREDIQLAADYFNSRAEKSRFADDRKYESSVEDKKKESIVFYNGFFF